MLTSETAMPAAPRGPAAPGTAVLAQGLRKIFVSRGAGNGREGGGGPRRRTVEAVAGLDLEVAEGEIFGLLGPNGAGKTTTLRMLCTLLEPSGGDAYVHGWHVLREAGRVRAAIGVMLGGERSTYWKLTGRENLEYFAALYHIPPAEARRRIGRVLEVVGLAERAEDFVERYSAGMRQRLALARALLHQPGVLMLDEPTLALDPQSARAIREFIVELNRESGTTVILTTHYMEEADQLSHRVGIIDGGRIAALDTPAALKARLQEEDLVELEVVGFGDGLEPALQDLEGVEQVAVAVTDPAVGGASVRVRCRAARKVMPDMVSAAGRCGARVQFVRIAEPSLEDVFIALTGRALRD